MTEFRVLSKLFEPFGLLVAEVLRFLLRASALDIRASMEGEN